MGLINNKKDGYTNYNLGSIEPGLFPKSEDLPILSDVYKYTGKKTVSDRSYSDIWWEYPEFKVGSYKQITNNLRYYDNPDNGTCIGAEFCNALYENKNVKSDYVLPLPPISKPNESRGSKARVNYYWAHPDILLQPKPNYTLEPNYN